MSNYLFGVQTCNSPFLLWSLHFGLPVHSPFAPSISPQCSPSSPHLLHIL